MKEARFTTDSTPVNHNHPNLVRPFVVEKITCAWIGEYNYLFSIFLVRAPPPAPPRPPPPVRHHRSMIEPRTEPPEADNWKCSACTFANHPALDKCEMCGMPLMTTSHTAPSGPYKIPALGWRSVYLLLKCPCVVGFG